MKGKGALAVLLLVIVIIFFVYFMRTEEKAPIEEEISRFNQTRAELTTANLESVSRVILEWMADSDGQVPDSLNDLQKTRSYGLSLQDGWGRNIRYEKVSDSSFRLRSAGPDGQFGTEDDILKEY
ncbi:MAG: hypothetical protein PHQ25_05420 [Acidobacteriota bacterium]|nr:hypothetical protein [Acidobacteriota bacterium]MDW3229095.1 hypothetical protein [Acidobacteriota bacterium]MDY0231624.1 hypothetical protein [Candidatus Saccharicenans sp.]